MTEMKIKEKRWGIEIEKSLLPLWSKEKIPFNIHSTKQMFSIDTPPPYPSGDMHPGQLAHYLMIDMIARLARMKGHETLFPLCLDRNGINIEMTVEKKTGKSIHDFKREDFIRICKGEIDKITDNILKLLERCGMSWDKDNSYYTDSPEYRAVSQSAFIEMWNKGLIKEDLRPNNYCPGCKTTIAEAEIVYKELPTAMYHIKWKVKETDEWIEIGTTRPELLCACQIVLVHPDDERYTHLHGKHVILPLYNREIEIRPHPYAKPEFGSGVVMVCSYGDSSDVQLFRELKLKPIVALDKSALLTKESEFLEGMNVKQGRKKIIKKLDQEKLIVKKEQTIHRQPTCERSEDPLEIISLKEWYIKQLEFLDQIRDIVKQMKFHPDKNKQILLDWIDAITIDWPISRRRYYHTEIPMWYCKKCNNPMVPEPGKYYQPWKEKPPFDKCSECGHSEFRGEERVFDTWVDSSMSSLYITGYGQDEKKLEKLYPATIRPQGREIVRTWLYYTLLRNIQLKNSKAFEHVWITGLGLDEKGKKMSKSKGNYMDPMPVIEKHGAEAFRYWAAAEVNVGDDFRISELRIAGASKFITKLWNVSRFISGFENIEKIDMNILKESDKWILTELNELALECNKGYDEFNFFIPANRIREFIWNIFAPHYIEMAKTRAYQDDKAALYSLHKCLKILLRLLAPINPFITDKVFREIYGKSIHSESLPKGIESCPTKDYTKHTEKIIEFNSEVWKHKKDKSIPLNAEITGIKIPDELKLFEAELKEMHKLV